MKRSILIAAGAAAALAIGACRQSADPAANDEAATDNGALVNNAAADTSDPAAAPMAAADFASTVAASDLYEIESGRLAATKASGQGIRSFGQMLVADHQKSTADLKAAAGQSSPPIEVAPKLTAEQQAQIDQLKVASGPEFDRQFIQQQVAAHEKALAAVQGYAANGENQALKGFATKASTVIQAHLDQLRGLGQQ